MKAGIWSEKPCVYIITNKREGVLYTGVTADLPRRNYEHKNKLIEGFAKKYNLTLLVYIEPHETLETAIKREKLIKRYRREWKFRLIEDQNPEWRDLNDQLL